MSTMRGTIRLHRLAIECIVGILPRERVEPQMVYLDVAMEHDFGAAAASENVSETVDYAAVAGVLGELVVSRQYQLIETMAVEGCATLLEKWDGLQRVEITVNKPAAVPEADNTSVTFAQVRA